MLESFRLQLQGKVAERLQISVAGRAEALLRRLIEEGVALWRSESFSRFSDGELACSVRLFDCLRRVIANNQVVWALVHIDYDTASPTAAMLAGEDDPTRAPRPDFGIRFARSRVMVEAKVLKLKDEYPKNYVSEGMRRFVDGKYQSDAGLPGLMIGYVVSDSTPDIVAEVNVWVTSDPALGQDHQLANLTVVDSNLMRSESVHSECLRIDHFAVDVSGRAVV